MWRSALALSVVALVAVVVAIPAAGAAPVESVAAPSLAVRSGVEMEGRRWVMAGQRVSIEGRTTSYEEDATVAVRVTRAGDEVAVVDAPLREAGAGGRFEARFTLRRPGRYLVAVEEADGTRVSEWLHAATARVRRGSRGAGVALLQHGLRGLGYATPTGGRYNAATARAALAYRKVNRMSRRTSAPRRLLSRVMDGEGAFRVRYPRAGRHVEFDWSRQVLVFARGARVERVYHASSGKASTPTVFGTFRFYRKQPGTNAKGMVHSNYFIRGYAIHGYRSVPTRPASHGCIRVPIPDSRFISRRIRLGERISVYR